MSGEGMMGKIIAHKYRILEQVGAGGMAQVYKAEQLTSPHRIVAIKMPKEEYKQDAAFLRRFETEANAVLVLSHENIVKLYGVGQDGDMPFIALEYVEGRTLKDMIKERGSLPTRALVSLGAQVLDALSHAHEKGIIHRDVKPQNIIVNKRGKVKLADFGIARVSADSDTVTYAGSGILGSVHYFSPEQAKGRSVTVESDLYSMGVTLYEMATGTVPFAGESSVAVALMHIQDELKPPKELNPEIPAAMNDIIVKALQKKPSMRYRSAKKMRRDLQRVLREPNGDFAKLASLDEPNKTKKKHGNHATIRIAATTVLILVFLGGLFVLGQSIIKSAMESNAVVLAPTLIGKTVAEARQLAELRGFTVVEAGRVSNQEVESGLIAEQAPSAGTQVPGGVIEVTVSLGSGELTYMPNVVGLTLAEAELLLEETGLERGTVDYRTSELPSGQVFKQDPAEGTQMLRGDDVTLFVSGVPTRSLEAPDTLGCQLTTAIEMFMESDFTRFRVRVGETHEVGGIVIKQSPTKGELGNADTVVQLTVTISEQPEYGTVMPLTMDVTENDTSLMIAVEKEEEGAKYELVVHEQILRKGKQELSIEIPSVEPGMLELIVYLNGQETMRLPAVATPLTDLYGGGE